MSLPRIDLHDGKHKMIIAEDGERVLTPEQNAEYERTHPDARKNPERANVYDGGGAVGGGASDDNAYSKEVLKGADMIHPSNEAPTPQSAPHQSQLGWAYDKGGAVQTPLGKRIDARANEIYMQAKDDGGQSVM